MLILKYNVPGFKGLKLDLNFVIPSMLIFAASTI
jgi:hypothetical protein